MKARQNKIALHHSFHDILILNTTDPATLKRMRVLRNKLINPGLYYKHLMNWLNHFPLKQMHMVDGEMLNKHPRFALQDLQMNFLETKIFFDYEKFLKYDKRKGFYCQVISENKTKCLGAGKGRKYEQIDKKSHKYLSHFYKKPNLNLLNFLKSKLFSIPIWLNEIN